MWARLCNPPSEALGENLSGPSSFRKLPELLGLRPRLSNLCLCPHLCRATPPFPVLPRSALVAPEL